MAFSEIHSDEVELHRAHVLALVHVEREKATTLDDADVDREPDAGRRLETEIEVERAEIPRVVGREGERANDAHVLHHRDERPQFALDVGAKRKGDRASLHLDPDGQAFKRHGPQTEVHRQLDLERAAAIEEEPRGGRDAHQQIELCFGLRDRQQLRQEAVALRGVDDDLASLRRRFEAERARRAATARAERHGERDTELLHLNVTRPCLAEDNERAGRLASGPLNEQVALHGRESGRHRDRDVAPGLDDERGVRVEARVRLRFDLPVVLGERLRAGANLRPERDQQPLRIDVGLRRDLEQKQIEFRRGIVVE